MTAGASLTREGLQALLAFLDPDRQRAAEKYEEARVRLVKLFECRGVAPADEAADETLDRVARRLAGGEHVRAVEPGAYIYGVARNVMRERWRQQRRLGSAIPLAEGPPVPFVRDDDAEGLESRMECLEDCLAALAPASRRLVLTYYLQTGPSRIAARKELAASLGITSNLLWVRAHRVRALLERCVRACVDGTGAMNRAGRPHKGEGREG